MLVTTKKFQKKKKYNFLFKNSLFRLVKIKLTFDLNLYFYSITLILSVTSYS